MYQRRPAANACRDSSAIRRQVSSRGGLLGQTLLQIRDPAQVGGLRTQIQGAQFSIPVPAQPSVPAAPVPLASLPRFRIQIGEGNEPHVAGFRRPLLEFVGKPAIRTPESVRAPAARPTGIPSAGSEGVLLSAESTRW